MSATGPPRHPLWLALLEHLAREYSPDCYEPLNTGPDALTDFLSRRCEFGSSVLVTPGFMSGPVTRHAATGSWTRQGRSCEHRMRAVHLCPWKRFATLNQSCTPLTPCVPWLRGTRVPSSLGVSHKWVHC